MFVCLCVCVSGGQRCVYVLKVSMRNIMVKSAQRQLCLRTYVFAIKGLFTYVAYLCVGLNSKDLFIIRL